MQIVNKLIKNLQQVTDEKQLKAFLFKTIELLEIDYFLLGISFPFSMNKSDFLIIDNYPEDWVKRYEKLQLVKIDPVAKFAAKNNSPIFWDQLNDPEMQLFKEMEKELFPNVHTGFTIPLHGEKGTFGVFSLSLCSDSHESQNKLQSVLHNAQILTPYLLDVVIRIRKEKVNDKVQLTKREVECLTWVTEGKSAWEISKILNCTERTVTFHLANATRKLNCTNRYQAISKAIITGIIMPKSM